MRRLTQQVAGLLDGNGGRLVTAVEGRVMSAAACVVPTSTACYHSQPPAHPRTPAYYDPSEFKSRKPSIKRPSLHQWHFCDASYDPMAPVNKADWQAQVDHAAQQPASTSSSSSSSRSDHEAQPVELESVEQADGDPQTSPAADTQQQQQQQLQLPPPKLLSPEQQLAAAAASSLPQLSPNGRGQAPALGQMLPPFAPLAAHFTDYHQIQYHDQLPRFFRKRHRYHMRKQQSLAQQRWRAAAEQRAAKAARLDAKVMRAAERQLRQAAWVDWCRQQQQWQQQ